MKNQRRKCIALSVCAVALFLFRLPYIARALFPSLAQLPFPPVALPASVETVLWITLLCLLKMELDNRRKIYITDLLTGGYNREGFIEAAQDQLFREHPASFVVVYLNVSEFTQINEYLGENRANQLLLQIYHILKRSLRGKELVSRSNMDRFVLLLKEENDEQAKERVDRIIEQVKTEITLLDISFSVGASRLNNDCNLLGAIYNASYMSQQKNARNHCEFYDKKIAQKRHEEKELMKLFEASLKNKDFQVYLQPKVPTDDKEVLQAEALVRWVHPEKGMIYPDKFIPLLEKYDRIGELDLYMFEAVCQIAERWLKEGRTGAGISVNLSRKPLLREGKEICEKYKRIKDKYNIPDGLIKLELTESAMFDFSDIQTVQEILDGFHDIGLKLALDDFGFAYSSLALLGEFDIDVLKLDRAFFINDNGRTPKIVESIIKLAHELGICVVAEGIEVEHQVETLTELNCDFIQGYYYSKPLPVAEFEAWRESYEKQRA